MAQPTPPPSPPLLELASLDWATAAQLSQIKLPTMYDLPSEDPEEPGVPDEFHALQPQLLARTLRLLAHLVGRVFHVADMNLYYDPDHLSWYKRPDWFLAIGVPRLYGGSKARWSYVLWDEKVPPTLTVEFLSPGTEAEDLGPFYVPKQARTRKTPRTPAPLPPMTRDPGSGPKPPRKFEVYEQILKVPHHVVYDSDTELLRYFQLVDGRYQEQVLQPTAPAIWIPELELGLGLWHGEFEGVAQTWLRWCEADGTWCLTDTELERAEKLAERRAKDRERRARKAAQREAAAAQEATAAAQEAQQLAEGLTEAERQGRLAAEAQLAALLEQMRRRGIEPDALAD
jgi:Uma2 family endonuclease